MVLALTILVHFSPTQWSRITKKNQFSLCEPQRRFKLRHSQTRVTHCQSLMKINRQIFLSSFPQGGGEELLACTVAFNCQREFNLEAAMLADNLVNVLLSVVYQSNLAFRNYQRNLQIQVGFAYIQLQRLLKKNMREILLFSFYATLSMYMTILERFFEMVIFRNLNRQTLMS